MKRVLVVDDNMASLKQIGAQLSGNYQVSLSKSGPQALKICGQAPPDLILLDVEMPDMDGFETIAALKGEPEFSRIPVIFLTGNHDVATELRALESGAVDFITKPAERNILLHRLELHLQFNDYQTDLENTVKELENSIVISFADLIECKNDNSGGHVLRTSKYVEILGHEVLRKGLFEGELTTQDVEMIARAAPFHDIGKIGVSDVILLKPGPLSDEEYEAVKKHTTIGARVLSNIYDRTPTQRYLKYAATVAEGHHERYDGKGYPKGIAGNEIPLCCRIMAVANVYDACLTERIYRNALTLDEAYEVIAKGRGTEFDPAIVDVFESCYEKFPAMERNNPHLSGGWNRNQS
ncbi:MAG: response regulator [Synergistaceae bacterium]|jgi:putative two-component system response regulator|nr:response regulator [Synergistaceae bacterium]